MAGPADGAVIGSVLEPGLSAPDIAMSSVEPGAVLSWPWPSFLRAEPSPEHAAAELSKAMQDIPAAIRSRFQHSADQKVCDMLPM